MATLKNCVFTFLNNSNNTNNIMFTYFIKKTTFVKSNVATLKYYMKLVEIDCVSLDGMR